MVVDEFMIMIKSGSDPTRGRLLRGFTFPDGSFNASFPGSELFCYASVYVVKEGSVAKLVDFVADISVNGGGDGGLEVANRCGLAMDGRFELIDTGSQVG